MSLLLEDRSRQKENIVGLKKGLKLHRFHCVIHHSESSEQTMMVSNFTPAENLNLNSEFKIHLMATGLSLQHNLMIQTL